VTKLVRSKKSGAQFTPLGIIAAFLALTEAVAGIAATQVSGEVQVALTTFVISFPILIAIAFFLILWNRPYVFYAPTEYGNVDPKHFMSAIRDAPMVVGQVELARSLEQNPHDIEARFSLIDAMADDVECQCVILMYETGKDLPAFSRYVYRHANGAGGSGYFGGISGKDRLEGTGLVRRVGGGRFLTLTDEGRRFAEWLIGRDRKCYFFWTPTGGWGSPEPGTPEEKWMQDIQSETKPKPKPNGPAAASA